MDYALWTNLGTPSCVLHLTGDLTLQLIAEVTQGVSSGKVQRQCVLDACSWEWGAL